MSDVYDLKSVKLPYLAGGALKLFAALLEGPLQGLLIPNLFESAGITWLRKRHFDEPPTNLPIHYTGLLQTKTASVPEAQWPGKPSQGKGFHFDSIYDFAEAYRDGRTTPEEVAEKVLDSIEASDSSDKPLRAFIAVYREEAQHGEQPASPDMFCLHT